MASRGAGHPATLRRDAGPGGPPSDGPPCAPRVVIHARRPCHHDRRVRRRPPRPRGAARRRPAGRVGGRRRRRARSSPTPSTPHPLTALAPDRAPARLTSWADRVALLERGRRPTASSASRRTPNCSRSRPRRSSTTSSRASAPGRSWRATTSDSARARARRRRDARRARRGPEASRRASSPRWTSRSPTRRSSGPRAPSSRWLLERGRVRDAAPRARPAVRAGGRGRARRPARPGPSATPPANLSTDCLPPGDGVYAGLATLPDGAVLPAAIHAGPRATFDAPERTVEAFVMRP